MLFPCLSPASRKSGSRTSQSPEVPSSPCGKEGVKTTVIIGGGVIGLSTAYWLSRMKASKRERIIVLEALDQCFLDASGHNSGLISSHWFSGELRKLADHSFDIYQNVARTEHNFTKTSDYHENSLFKARRGPELSDPRAPSWVNLAQGWHLESEPSNCSVPKEKDVSSSMSESPISATM
jgi:hypothetical protein